MPTFHQLRVAARRAAVRTHRRGEDPPQTTHDDLLRWTRRHLRHQKVVIVSNREPYSHLRTGEDITWVRNAGGLTVALDAVARAIGGVWVASGTGSADRETVDERDHAPCPPDQPGYTLRRLWLSDEDHDLYYAGFCNSALWPLCHIVYVRPQFRVEEWERYQQINHRFADAVMEETGDAPALVFLQDYHMALAARYIREKRPQSRLALFWHIPWPNAEVVRRLPWRAEILDGLLANDVLGFHVRLHALNFLQTVADTLEARVDFERMSIDRGGHRTWVRSLSIGVDASEISVLADTRSSRTGPGDVIARMRPEGGLLGLGVDRLDYTKGIPERLDALERLYEKYPQWVERFHFVQIAVPSRIEIEEYRTVGTRTREAVARINERFGRPDRPVVHLIEQNVDFRDLIPFYAAADLCAVTPLHDGMNLVAKEYVAACVDLEGTLVLSPFAGAARELDAAWVVSPYDREALADTFHAALSEPRDARRARMRTLREIVQRHTVFDWAINVLDAAVRVPRNAGPHRPEEAQAPHALLSEEPPAPRAFRSEEAPAPRILRYGTAR